MIDAHFRSASPSVGDRADGGSYIDINGDLLWHFQGGDPMGPPTVLLHGSFSSASSWGAQFGDFTDAGIVRRIEPAGHAMLFELRIGDNHHHLVCTSCGAVQDVDCAVGHAPCLHPSDTHGFTLSSAEVTYWGLCPSCAAAAA